MSTSYSVIEKYMEEEPKLKEYEFNFKDMYRYQEHTLSEQEEKILSILSDTLSSPSETYEALTDSDMEYGNIIDKDGNNTGHIEAIIKKIRVNNEYKGYLYDIEPNKSSPNVNEDITSEELDDLGYMYISLDRKSVV